MVIDYDEDDSPIKIGEKEIEIPQGYFVREMNKLYFDSCIMGWKYSKQRFYINLVPFFTL